MERGELVQWNDARGFGFILADNGERYFVHMSNIARIATRPRAGDLVSLTPGKGPDGRLQARSVSILGANPKPSQEQMRRGTETSARWTWRLAFAGLLAVLAAYGLAVGNLPLLVVGLYLVIGFLSFAAYGADKQYAETGQWRISEATLLGLDLAFGMTGGLLGQDYFRHKTRKPGYVATTVLLSVVHLLWLGGFAFGLISADTLPDLLAELTSIIP